MFSAPDVLPFRGSGWELPMPEIYLNHKYRLLQPPVTLADLAVGLTIRLPCHDFSLVIHCEHSDIYLPHMR
jgi:hypothetical protein